MSVNSEIVEWSRGKTELIFEKIFSVKDSIEFDEDAILIIDQNVFNGYSQISKHKKTIKIEASERIKSLEIIQSIYKQFLEFGVDRSSVIYGIGGGITCDIAGFISATYYRGTRLVLVPTTLLAMTDAAIGGKNGVNFEGHKNIIGTIRQPEKIIFDTGFLKTLPEIEIINGMAEVIKQGIISGEDLFNEINNKETSEKIMNGSIPYDLLKRIVQVKIDIVKGDEFENERRRILNFGHTLGHIIELRQSIKHGEAVSIGVIMTIKLSIFLKKCNQDILDKIMPVFNLYNLPIETSMELNEMIDYLGFDKKKKGSNIHFVFIEELGKVYDESIPIDALSKYLYDVFTTKA